MNTDLQDFETALYYSPSRRLYCVKYLKAPAFQTVLPNRNKSAVKILWISHV